MSERQRSTKKHNNRTTLYRWWRRFGGKLSWAIIGVAILLTLLLGIAGFDEADGNELPFGTRVYLALQLFTMESGAVTDRADVGWTLEIARWMAVIAAFGTVINTLLAVFSKQIHSFYLSRLSGHVIIVGSGDGGAKLAGDLIEQGRLVVVIEKDPNADNLLLLEQIGVAECFGDATDRAVLEAVGIGAAEMIVVLAGDDAINLAIANSVRLACQGRTIAGPLRAIVDVTDARLFAFACPESEEVEFSRVSRRVNSARALFSNHPLDGSGIGISDPDKVHLFVIGFNPMAEALVLQALSIMHFANQVPSSLTVITEDAQKKKQRLICQIPELEACGRIVFCEGDVSDAVPRQLIQDAFDDSNQRVTIAICNAEFKNVLADALDVAPLMPQRDGRLFLQASEGDERGFHIQLKDFPHLAVELFGQTETACCAQYVIGEELDELAKRIHQNYVEKRLAEGDREEEFPAIRPWRHLSNELKTMNRQQADHISVKLRALGLRMVAQTEGVAGWPRQPTAEEIEMLAKAEHDRWATCKRLAGWRSGPVRDNALRIHPDLVPWSDLTDATQDYDRDPVRKLPELLCSIGYQLAIKPKN